MQRVKCSADSTECSGADTKVEMLKVKGPVLERVRSCLRRAAKENRAKCNIHSIADLNSSRMDCT